MSKFARAALCTVAVLEGASAFRIKQKKNKQPVASLATLLQEEQDPAPASCNAGNLVLSAVRAAVNGALGLALRGADPANVTFHAGQWDVDLPFCNIGLEMDSTMQVEGFGGANIDELSCLQEECLEEGRWGCAKQEYTFGGTVLFGNIVEINGKNSADWSLCGKEINDKDISIGAQSVEPGLTVEFVIIREGLTGYKIKTIQGLQTSWGTLQNFKCGFSALPGFIGSHLESWCENIIEFVAEKAQLHLVEHIDRLLLSLINKIVEVPEEAAEGGRISRKEARPWSRCGLRGWSADPSNGTSISIVNGQPAAECTWRWQVGLQRSTLPTALHFCGGSLITPEWVLTAAHCVARWTFYFDAVAGGINPRLPDGTEQRRKVVQVIRHPDYPGSASKGMDFALLRLERPVELSDCVGTVCLPEGGDVSPKTTCWATGWGTRGKGTSKAEHLQEVSVDTISSADCTGANSDYNESQITSSMLCAQGKTLDGKITDACTGDSGGPLVCQAPGTNMWTLYGATSWGKGCAEERNPGVWARVHTQLDWIADTLERNAAPPVPEPGNCPFDTFRPNVDAKLECQCTKGHFCSTNGVDTNCPTSEGPGGRGGTRFLQTCSECKCVAEA